MQDKNDSKVTLSYCYNCGTERKLDADVCLECGKYLKVKNQPNENSEADSKANLGLILSIVSFFMPIPIIDIAMSGYGAYLGHYSRKLPNLNIEKTAIAAEIIGIIALIFNALVWIIFLSAF